MPSSHPAEPAASTADFTLSPRMRAKALLGGMAGNVIEFLDFAVYGLVAATISRVFFADGDPTAALLATFLVYATSFVIRPFGGIVLGRLGDRWGRKRLLALTVSGMCVSTAFIGVLPGYATLGSGATVLLVVGRLAQGFFAGGEFAGATSYITESGSRRPRAYWATWSSSSAYVGSVVGLGAFSLVSALMSDAAFQSWGWRVLFLIAVPLGVGGAYIRYRLDESPEFKAIEKMRAATGTPPRSLGYVLRTQWKQILSYVLFQASHTLPDYLLIGFFVTYLTVFVGQPASDAGIALLVARIVLIFSTIGSGWLNDRIGRKRTLVTGCAMIIPLIFGVFAIARIGTLPSAIASASLLAVTFPLVSSAMCIGLVEMFPADVRVTAGSVAYNIGTSLFGGTTPLVATFLVATFHTHFAVPTYVAVVAIISLVSVLIGYQATPRTDTRPDDWRTD